MKRHWPIFTIALLSGCLTHAPLSQGVIVVRPEILKGSHQTQAIINPYTESSIKHLAVRLYLLPGEALLTEKDLLAGHLANPITFSNLKANTSYRLRALAYKEFGTNPQDLISIEDENSHLDILVNQEDHPSLTSLTVRLIDIPFSGQATGTITINPGSYTPIGSEQMRVYGPSGIAITLAGNGTAGTADGIGTTAQLTNPNGVTIDKDGNLYIAESGTHRIRKITPAGVVTTLAGSGSGYAEGMGTLAKFNAPTDITVDGDGNLYVADSTNHRIRKITPAGLVSTLAGSTQGTADAVGTSAQFNSPYGISLDGAGNVFVADDFNHRIRKIAPNGSVTTIAGSTIGYTDASGTLAQFNRPIRITPDAAGNLYVVDYMNNRFRKIAPNGAVTTMAGGAVGYVDGLWNFAKMNRAQGFVLDARGNFYFSDTNNQCIRMLEPNGVMSTLAGNGTAGNSDGTGTMARFNAPTGITIDASGDLYVVDTYNHRILKIY